jgi:anti-sigma B factor antagonist
MSIEISEKKQDGTMILSVKGRVDSNTSPAFEQKILELIKCGEARFVLNFEELDYISSAGLRVLLKAVKDLKKSNGALHLCCIKDYIKEVFVMSGFDAFLPIHATVEDSLKAIP